MHGALRPQLIDKTRGPVISWLEREDVATLPTSAIQGDLLRDNLLFNQRGPSGAIDVHHTALGILIYDLPVVASEWCTDAAGGLDGPRMNSVLVGYDSLRRLEGVELGTCR